jgi:hypothetical protein
MKHYTSTRWEKGRGLVEKVNNFTGEIMCLEEVPAEYQTVTKSIKESEGRMVWQEVLCETNAPELVKTQPAFTEIHAQSRSIPQQNLSDKDSGKKDWFFL